MVEFATYSDMKGAIDKLDDTELGGRRIRVEEDKPRSSRRRRLVEMVLFVEIDFFYCFIIILGLV